MPRPANPLTRTKLLEAAFAVIRSKGYSATTVDDICRAAGLSKGAFFHHFASKEELAVAAALHWSETTGALFESAPYHTPADPLERLLAYVAFRREIIQDDGAGGLRHQPRDPEGLLGIDPWPCRDAGARHRGRHARPRHRRGLDGREPRAPHPGRAAGGFYPGQGQRGTAPSGREHRPPLPLHRRAVRRSRTSNAACRKKNIENRRMT